MYRIILATATVAVVTATAGCAASSAGVRAPGGAGAGVPGAVQSGQLSAAGLPGLGSAIPKADPPLGQVRAIGSAAGIRLPLDRYALTPAQMNRLSTAENLAAHVCLRRLGIDLPDRALSPRIMPTEVPRYQLHFLSVPLARQSGYGRPETSPAGPAPAADLPGLSRRQQAAAMAAFYGAVARIDGRAVPKGGCHGWGLRAILSPRQPVDPLNMIYQSEAYTLGDARMLGLFARWRSCTAAQGIGAPNPLAAQQGPSAHEGWPARPDAQEMAAATADARCRQQVNMEGTWLALMTAYEREYLASDLPQIVKAKQVSDQWLGNAAAYGA